MAKQAVQIDSGPVSAKDSPGEVPKEQWHDLMLARRYFLEVHLSSDCRCLVEFVNDAKIMFRELGFASDEEMIREGYKLEPEEIAVAVEWLRLNPPDEPVSLDSVTKLAAKNQAIDAQDRANQRPVGTNQYAEDVYNNKDDVHTRPSGNSSATFLRRLRKDRPDIHARVLAGEITAHAGMIEAGFRKKRPSKRSSPLEKILKLLPQLNEAEVETLIACALKMATFLIENKCKQHSEEPLN